MFRDTLKCTFFYKYIISVHFSQVMVELPEFLR